jgi:beta-lactam-binding protein with PASTA domain
MKSIIRLTLLSLILLIVALISAVSAMRFAIHGREVAIPKLIGMTPVEADRATSASGLQVVVERQYYSADVAEGKIMMQVPDAGSKVRRGWQVRVAQSLGPQRIAIPSVSGSTSRAAQMTIQRRGLDLGSTSSISIAGVPPDQVVAQSPTPNASGVSAPRISLLVATAPDTPAFVMPNFVGQPLGTAATTLQAAGMRLGTVSVKTETPDAIQPAAVPPGSTNAQPTQSSTPLASPESLILSQTPAAGQKITAGSPINFEVSK